MSTNHVDELKNLQKLSSELGKGSPGVMRAFGSLHHEAMADGEISLKTKEMIAVGISITIRCTGCIQSHVKAALDAGVTPEEMHEVISVAIMMAGGPGTAYGALALEAMNQYLAE